MTEQAEAGFEQQISEKQRELFTKLTDEEKAKLSKVLFPDTDLDTIEILGKVRTIKPLPVKYAKLVHEASIDLGRLIAEAYKKPGVEILDDRILPVLSSVVKILAGFYSWSDIEVAVEKEELSLSELQGIVALQAAKNGANDFLLGPLRVVLKTMQLFEVIQLKFQTMSTMLG